MAETETVSLNLDGSFETVAARGARAAESLAGGLDAVGSAAGRASKSDLEAKFQREAKATREFTAALGGAKTAMAGMPKIKGAGDGGKKAPTELEKARTASKKAAGRDETGDAGAAAAKRMTPLALKGTPQVSEFAGIVGKLSSVLGPDLTSGIMSGASGLMDAAQSLGPAAKLLGPAGKAIAVGGGVVLGAAVALTAAAAALTVAGAKLAIAQSTKKETQLIGLRGNEGARQFAFKAAADFGLDEDVALKQVQKGLQAKFSKEEIRLQMKIAAGMDVLEGQGKGQAFLEKMQKIKLKPKVDEGAINDLAETGIDTKAVYAELAKSMGVTVPQAQAKLKAGAVDTQKVLDAIGKVGNKSFGDIAEKMGNTLPNIIGTLKAELLRLFEGANLQPLKDFFNGLIKVVQGPAGAKLKGAISELFSTLFDVLFGGLKDAQGKLDVGKLVNEITGGLKGAAAFLKAHGKDINATLGLMVMGMKLFAMGVQGFFIIVGTLMEIGQGIADAVSFILDPFGKMAEGISTIKGTILGEATGLGADLVNGIIAGIDGMAGGAVSAIVSVVRAMMGAAKAESGTASPSKKYAEEGKYNVMGLAKGANDNAGIAEDAMAGVAEKTGAAGAEGLAAGAEGARGAAGAPGAAGGRAGGGGGDTINLYISGVPTNDAEAIYEVFQKNRRREGRDQREGRRVAGIR